MSVSFNSAINAYNNAAKIKIDNNGSDLASSIVKVSGNAVPDFAKTVNGLIDNAASSLNNAERMTSKALIKQADIADVVTAVTSAEVTLKTVIAVRDRLIAAHQEILRMPI